MKAFDGTATIPCPCWECQARQWVGDGARNLVPSDPEERERILERRRIRKGLPFISAPPKNNG